MTYTLPLTKANGGYQKWFENSYNALYEIHPHISVSDTMYEQEYNVMLTLTAVVFKSEDDAMLFLLRWNQ